MLISQSKKISYTVVFTADPNGGYTAEVPMLPGCISEGDTLEETKFNITEAIELYLESLIADGESIPNETEVVEQKISISINQLSQNVAENSYIHA